MLGIDGRRGGVLVRVLVALIVTIAVAAVGAGSADAQKQTATQPPAAGGPTLNAKAWILIDPRDGAVLASRSPNKRLPIASTTKLMTAYLALKHLKPSQMITAPAYHPQASAEIELGLRPGERMRVRDLLYGLLLPSASDAAETLAVGVAGSEPAFVTEMNQAARRLGLADTSYANPIGLDDPDNYSSARDLVTLASVLLRNPLFARIVNTPAATLRSGDHPRTVTSRDTLLNSVPWINGVKTGHTIGAGYVLVGSGTQGSTTLVSAVLGTPDETTRDAGTLRLLQYGFSLYHTVQPVHRGEELADPELDYRSDHLSLVAQRALPIKVRRGERVTTRVSAPDRLSGAVERGQVLGRVIVAVDGRRAAASPLVAARAVGAATTFDKVLSAAKNPFVLLGLVGIVILLGLLLVRRVRARDEPTEATPRPTNTRRQVPQQRTPEERRRMHEERMRRRRQRMERDEGTR